MFTLYNRFVLSLFLLCWANCQARETALYQADFSDRITYFILEFAKTDDELSWGLMQRAQLPENQGMLFIYDKPINAHVWSFNCLIDLSLAFIDGEHVIREIRDLKAYPDKMDPARPVHTIKDLSLYPPNDPIVRYFDVRGITSKVAIRYTLEMNRGWFKQHDVKVGDVVIWDEPTNSGAILHKK